MLAGGQVADFAVDYLAPGQEVYPAPETAGTNRNVLQGSIPGSQPDAGGGPFRRLGDQDLVTGSGKGIEEDGAAHLSGLARPGENLGDAFAPVGNLEEPFGGEANRLDDPPASAQGRLGLHLFGEVDVDAGKFGGAPGNLDESLAGVAPTREPSFRIRESSPGGTP